MFHTVKSVLTRPSKTLLEDFAGAAALVFLAIVGLSLPGLV